MDSYNKPEENKKRGTGPLGGTGPLKPGTGNLNMDSFRQTGTGQLGQIGTRRLASGPIEIEKTLSAMRSEIENGEVIVGKLEPRINVLMRAAQIAERPNEAARILAGIVPGEANFTKQVAQSLMQDPGTQRRVQVATYQFDQAKKGIVSAREVLDKAAQYEGTARAQYVDNNCHVEKLRGQLYPLINLHMVFREHPLISQLIPQPKASGPEDAAPPPPPPPPPPQAKPATGPLGGVQDPAVQQVVDTINKVTGNLKDKLFGAFKKPNQ